MDIIDQKYFERLDAQLQDIKQTMRSDPDTRELLKKIYQDNLPGKSEKQADLMAEEALDSVTEFYQDLDTAREDQDRLIDEKLSAILEDQNLYGRCAALLRIWQMLTAMTLDNAKAMGEMNAFPEAPFEREKISAEDASPELEAELLSSVKKLLKQYIFLPPLIPDITEILSRLTMDGDAELLLDAGRNQRDYLAALSMLAYVNVKSGAVPDIPEGTTLHEIAIIICAAHETYKAAAETEENGMTEAALSGLLGIIGLAAAVQLIITALHTAGAVPIFPISALAFFSSVFLIYCSVKVIEEGPERWKESCDAVTGTIVKAGQVLISGLKKLLVFVKDRLIPYQIAFLKKIYRFAARRMAGGKKYYAEDEEDLYETDPEKYRTPILTD